MRHCAHNPNEKSGKSNIMYTHSSHMWNIHRRMTTGDGDTAKKMRHLAHDIIIWRSLFKINALANDTSSGCEKFFISEIHKSPYRLYINAFSRYDATTIFQSFNVFNVLKANVVSINCIVLNKMKKNASVRFLRFLFSLVVNATRFFFYVRCVFFLLCSDRCYRSRQT